MNSFKQLEARQISRFTAVAETPVRKKLEGNLGTLRFIGSILEIYLPLMADTVVTLTGGAPAEREETFPQLSDIGLTPEGEPYGPGTFLDEPIR